MSALRHHFTPIGMAITFQKRKWKVTSVGEDVKTLGSSCTAEDSGCRRCGKRFGIELSCDPAIPLLGSTPNN